MGSYTYEQAETVAAELRKIARMWAYKMEFDADFVPDWSNSKENKHSVFFDHHSKKWGYTWACSDTAAGTPYFSAQAAADLVGKLNSGEVEF